MPEIKGGNIDNVGSELEMPKRLDVAAYYETSGAANNMFQLGEVIIGAHHANSAWYIADQRLPIGFAAPKEGAPVGNLRMHIVKGSKHEDLTEKFINFAVRQRLKNRCVKSFL